MGTLHRTCEITKIALSTHLPSKLFFVYKENQGSDFKIGSHLMSAVYDEVKGKFILDNPEQLSLVLEELSSKTKTPIMIENLESCLSSSKVSKINNFYIGIFPILSEVVNSISKEISNEYIIKNIQQNFKEETIREYNFHESGRQLEEMKRILETQGDPSSLQKDDKTDEEKITLMSNVNDIKFSFDTPFFISINRMVKSFGLEKAKQSYIESISVKSYLLHAGYNFIPTETLSQGSFYNQGKHFEMLSNTIKSIGFLNE